MGGICDILGGATLPCIFGSRMFFNLKEAAERGVTVDSLVQRDGASETDEPAERELRGGAPGELREVEAAVVMGGW